MMYSEPAPGPWATEQIGRPSDDELFARGIESGVNFSKYEDIPVKVTGEYPIPKAMESFKDSRLRWKLRSNIERSGYRTPTPVQKRAIPIILAGRDMMACAQTGCGKTAAFLLPIIHNLLENPVPDGEERTQLPARPRAVIMSPTRELAIQIWNEARKFCYQTPMRCVVVYGGTSRQFQLHELEQGVEILIATPGRLLDYVDEGVIIFEKCRFIILDEADRMLVMGFNQYIQKLIR